MAYDRFLIAPINTGWQNDLKPWLIPDDAFQLLLNMYVFRGRLRKRFGSRYMGLGGSGTGYLSSRLAINIGTTTNIGGLSATVPGIVYAVGQQFSIGTEIFTVSVTGTPGVMLRTGTSTTHTYNTTSGALVIAGAAALTAVYFYPATPVMGLTVLQEGPINNQPSYGFDTQFAYTFDASADRWIRSDTGGLPVFTGTDTNFFWAENYQSTVDSDNALFVTNYNYNLVTPANADHIWSLVDGTWSDFTPSTIFSTPGGDVDTASRVQSCQIIVSFGNRLLLLNPVEETLVDGVATTAKQFVNRCRYSAIGSPFAGDAWLGPNNSYTDGPTTFKSIGASFIDASTEEAIVGAEFIKNHLIVFFESSTWELVQTGNENYPFSWQKLNTELGSESTFSTVPFDRVVMAVGSTGVHACNGSNVERIDNKIPDKIFKLFNPSTGVARIWGIRDYFTEMVYWCVPVNSQKSTQPYPSQVLTYNYKNNSWALNDDTITCFGYFQQQQALQLQNWHIELQESHWELNGGDVAQNVRQVIAGNQQGFVYLIDSDISSNCNARQITNIALSAGGSIATITCINHMFVPATYVAPLGINGIAEINVNIYRINTTPTQHTFTIQNDSVPFVAWTGTYTGGGTLGLVSNTVVFSKQWNPYVTQDRNVFLAKIDFAVQATVTGQITVDYLIGSGEQGTLNPAEQTGTLIGTGILETFPYPSVTSEQDQERLWHPIYFQGEGQCIQLTMQMSDAQIRDPEIAFEDLQIEGMALYTKATSSRLQ